MSELFSNLDFEVIRAQTEIKYFWTTFMIEVAVWKRSHNIPLRINTLDYFYVCTVYYANTYVHGAHIFSLF